MNTIKNKLWIALCICALIPLNYALAQTKDKDSIAISTEPFGDSMRHWYMAIDVDHNIINHVENQPVYDESEYTKIADNMLLFQRNNGGWMKNYDMKAILTPEQVKKVLETKSELHTTIDNSTTYTHIYYLAQVYTATKAEKYKMACLKGISFLLDAQYNNGGWPQYYPLEKKYSSHITYNDGAYIGVMELLKKIIDNDPNFAFVDNKLKAKVNKAFNKGIDCIINTQIKEKGRLTAWCQQHDEFTLAPAWARKYEMPSISNGESVGIVLFLMELDQPNDKVINAVQSAVKWFQDSKIYNTRVNNIVTIDPSTNKKVKDKVVVNDPTAPPIWTRYYELETEKPMFSDRDSKTYYNLSEVSLERRGGYSWYTDAPEKVLKRYHKWQQKWAPSNDVLKK